MTARDRSTRPGEAGFVLIGVVIFVLALTIIGISLFSLSSYEAQFLQRSIDGEQAFQSAVGGLDRARFVLTLPAAQLADVQNSLPPGVVRTVAIQRKGAVEDSTGPVDWAISADSVLIRVTAGQAGAQRMVEGFFRPIRTQNYYSQLITVSEGIEVEPESSVGPVNRDRTVLLDGPIWESSAQDTSQWLDHLRPPVPVGIRTWPADSVRVPVPDVAPFFALSGTIAIASEPDPFSVKCTLDASATPGVPAYFRAEGGPSGYSFNSYPRTSCEIQVRGLAVWLMPDGALFNQGTAITGDPSTDCLVIIAAGPKGIEFWGRLVAYIPVILVSSGQVALTQGNDYETNSSTVDLSIFARSARFTGPWAGAIPPVLMPLHRDLSSTGPLNTLFLDALASQGALPNASWGGRRLDLIPGSWHASDR